MRWVGTGFEYWKCHIPTDAKLENQPYNQYIFTIGGGYAWKFFKNFYLNRWAAAHVRLAEDKEVKVDAKIFKPSAFLPEVSVKIGWHF